MKFDVITLFPEMFKGPLTESILKRAQEKGLIDIELHQLRDFATDKHKTVDDSPCGGGPGMILKVDVIDRAIQSVILNSRIGGEESDVHVIPHLMRDSQIDPSVAKPTQDDRKRRIILLAPSGEKFTQQKAIELSKYDNLILVCGHYEGFDQRIHEHLVDEEISIGDYVLTGGELPAMVMIDAISRMVLGVIKEESAANETFMPPTKLRIKRKYEITNNLNSHCEESRSLGYSGQAPQSETNKLKPNSYNLSYDYPGYTRPIQYKGWKVPEVLLSGDHKKIEEWRQDYWKLQHK